MEKVTDIELLRELEPDHPIIKALRTEEDRATSQQLMADYYAATDPRTTSERFAVGMGRGFTDAGEGVKQLYLDAKAGVMSPRNIRELDAQAGIPLHPAVQEANDYAQRVQQERDYYENTPIGKSGMGAVGRFTGNVLPYMAVPTPQGAFATLPRAAGTGSLFGATAGLLQFPEGDTPIDRFKDRGANSAIGAVIGGLSGTAGYGANKALQRHVVNDINRLNPDEISSLQAKAKAAGIELTPAEITNLSSLKAQQKALGNIQSSSGIMDDFYQNRNAQVNRAVSGLLDDISPIDDAASAGFMGRDAANNAINAQIAARSQKAGPLFKEAFKNEVEIKNVIDGIDDQLTTAKGPIASSLRRVKSYLMAGDKPERSLEAIHNAKMSIDDLISTAKNQGHRNAVRELMQVKSNLLRTIDAQVPGYKIARDTFAGDSGIVNKLDKSIVKVIADIPDTRVQQLAGKVFNPNTNSPQSVKLAREAIESIDPNSWRALTRAHIQDVWEDAGREFVSTNANMQGAKFRASLFGDVKKQRILKAAMNEREFKAVSDLMDVLEATGRVKPIGSDTAWNQEVIKEMRQSMGGQARYFAKPHTLLNRINDFFEESKLGKNAEKLSKIVTSPEGMAQLKQLRQMKPGTQKWIAKTAVILGINTGDQ